METRKIALACFVGGIICTAIAFTFAPMFWWIGLLAGFAAGYLCYDLREVFQAIPIAWRNTKKYNSERLKRIRAYLKHPHPSCYPATLGAVLGAVIGPIIFLWLLESSPGNAVVNDLMKSHFHPIFILCALNVFLVCVLIEICFFIAAILGIFALIGARIGERCFWRPFTHYRSYEKMKIRELEKENYRKMPMSYKNLCRWIIKGIALTILFFMWTMWEYLAIEAWAILRLIPLFLWRLFKLIHSNKRLLCGIDGAIGGAIAYLLFTNAYTTPLITPLSIVGQIVTIFYGGLIGAGFGIVNYEIISKRLLQINNT